MCIYIYIYIFARPSALGVVRSEKTFWPADRASGNFDETAQGLPKDPSKKEVVRTVGVGMARPCRGVTSFVLLLVSSPGEYVCMCVSECVCVCECKDTQWAS